MQQCPCCDYFALAERGKCVVCPVCFWEDDCADPEHPDWDAASDLNEGMTLRQARRNFQTHEACKPSYAQIVIHKSERATLRVETRQISG